MPGKYSHQKYHGLGTVPLEVTSPSCPGQAMVGVLLGIFFKSPGTTQSLVGVAVGGWGMWHLAFPHLKFPEFPQQGRSVLTTALHLSQRGQLAAVRGRKRVSESSRSGVSLPQPLSSGPVKGYIEHVHHDFAGLDAEAVRLDILA